MTIQNSDDAARRAYWAEQMELGYALIQKVLPFKVAECGEGFASIPDAAESAGIEMQFSTSKIAGNLDRVFFMRESLVKHVLDVGREMNERGWILKIEDGFRTLEMQGQLVRKPEVFDVILQKCVWENGGTVPSVEMVFRRALVMIANIPKIGTHMSGSAIDVSVFRREDGSEVWRGVPYLEISERTPMRSPYVSAEDLMNRLEITEMLEKRGLVHFPYEFWHFNMDDAMGHVLRDIPGPCRFGPVNWDPKTNRVAAVENPMNPLNPLDVIDREIAAATARAEAKLAAAQ
jgi:zinc D-Ala-D-Ala dipeptidase